LAAPRVPTEVLSEKQIAELLPLVKELAPKLNAYLGSIGSLEKRRRSLAKIN
jgi:hypothetical protein